MGNSTSYTGKAERRQDDEFMWGFDHNIVMPIPREFALKLKDPNTVENKKYRKFIAKKQYRYVAAWINGYIATRYGDEKTDLMKMLLHNKNMKALSTYTAATLSSEFLNELISIKSAYDIDIRNTSKVDFLTFRRFQKLLYKHGFIDSIATFCFNDIMENHMEEIISLKIDETVLANSNAVFRAIVLYRFDGNFSKDILEDLKSLWLVFFKQITDWESWYSRTELIRTKLREKVIAKQTKDIKDSEEMLAHRIKSADEKKAKNLPVPNFLINGISSEAARLKELKDAASVTNGRNLSGLSIKDAMYISINKPIRDNQYIIDTFKPSDSVIYLPIQKFSDNNRYRNFRDDITAHAISIVINQKDKIVYFNDSEGVYTDMIPVYKAIASNFINLSEYTIIPIMEIASCPIIYKGQQSGFQGMTNDRFCQTWALFIASLLINNQDSSVYNGQDMNEYVFNEIIRYAKPIVGYDEKDAAWTPPVRLSFIICEFQFYLFHVHMSKEYYKQIKSVNYGYDSPVMIQTAIDSTNMKTEDLIKQIIHRVFSVENLNYEETNLHNRIRQLLDDLKRTLNAEKLHNMDEWQVLSAILFEDEPIEYLKEKFHSYMPGSYDYMFDLDVDSTEDTLGDRILRLFDQYADFRLKYAPKLYKFSDISISGTYTTDRDTGTSIVNWVMWTFIKERYPIAYLIEKFPEYVRENNLNVDPNLMKNTIYRIGIKGIIFE